jgi:predicted CxxxxCH...CXXCH cytochrome family protein
VVVCHKVPGLFNETGHVDSDLPAEVLFSGLAIEEDAGGVWNGTGCSGIYCHGGFELGESGNSPKWTLVDGTQAVCGSCHGLPPGGEHPDTTQCNLCHGTVVDVNNKINDLTKHINGIQELDIAWHDKVYFPIYSGKHMNKWHDDCAICHNVNGNKKEFTCFSCHTHNKDKLDAEHSDVSAYVYNSEACYSCHPDGTVPDDH